MLLIRANDDLGMIFLYVKIDVTMLTNQIVSISEI